VALREVESHTPGILDCFTDQSISTRKQQSLLDARRVITDYIHHELHVLRIFYLPARYIHRPHVMTDQDTSQLTYATDTSTNTIVIIIFFYQSRQMQPNKD